MYGISYRITQYGKCCSELEELMTFDNRFETSGEAEIFAFLKLKKVIKHLKSIDIPAALVVDNNADRVGIMQNHDFEVQALSGMTGDFEIYVWADVRRIVTA